MAPSLCILWLGLLWVTQFCSFSRFAVSSGKPSCSSVRVSSILVFSLSEDWGVLSIRDAIRAFWYCCLEICSKNRRNKTSHTFLSPVGHTEKIKCSPFPDDHTSNPLFTCFYKTSLRFASIQHPNSTPQHGDVFRQGRRQKHRAVRPPCCSKAGIYSYAEILKSALYFLLIMHIFRARTRVQWSFSPSFSKLLVWL